MSPLKNDLALLQAQPSLVERVLQGLSTYLEGEHRANVVDFFESTQYLGQRLYPRQRLILKVYNRIPLEQVPCYLCSEQAYPNPACRWCRGIGVYDEFEDAKELLACRSPYARMYVPGLCEHHISGKCEKEICHARQNTHDYRILSDEEIHERLMAHPDSYILCLVAGRRGSKSFLLSGMECYSAFELVADPSPQRTYGLSAASTISVGNAANEEKQAKIIFDQAKAMLQESPWFQKVRYEAKDVEVEFVGRNLTMRCYHANATSIRGNTNIDVYLDEYLVMAPKAAMEIWRALAYSTATFARFRKRHVVIASSPGARDGMGYEIFDGTARGVRDDAVSFQLASWEMNPNLTKADFAADYALDPEGAEIELGAQFADSVRTYIPAQAVDDMVRRNEAGRPTLRNYAKAKPGVLYSLHFDNSQKNDPAGLVITHWDEEAHEVVIDWVEQFDPRMGDERIVTLNEIDHEKVLKYILDLRDVHGFHFQALTFDQFNSAWLVQRLRTEFNDLEGKVVMITPATDKRNRDSFSTLRSLVVQAALASPEHQTLSQQLKELVLIRKEGSGAWKVEAPARAHDDLADALAESAYNSLEFGQGRRTGIRVVEVRHSNTHLLPATDPPAAVRPGEPPHHEECTSRYCHYECLWRRAFINGTLPKI